MTVPSILEKFPGLKEHEKGIEKRQLLRWQDSPAIVALSDHLQSWPHAGVKLVESWDGRPKLAITPGVTREEVGRWNFCIKAVELVSDALADLVELIEAEALPLPREPKPMVGPWPTDSPKRPLGPP